VPITGYVTITGQPPYRFKVGAFFETQCSSQKFDFLPYAYIPYSGRERSLRSHLGRHAFCATTHCRS